MTDLGPLVDPLLDGVDAVFLFAPTGGTYERAQEIDDLTTVVVAAEDQVDADNFVELPLQFENLRERVRYGVEGAMDKEFVAEGETLIGLLDAFDDESDTLVRVRADESFQSGVYNLFTNSRPDPGVIRDVLEVAIELGKKGQKGKPVGALFVVGDAGKVMNKSRSLSYNPFEKSHVMVGDPIVNVMLKEFSRLDGAFVISDSGKIVSAYRYLEPAAEGVDIPKGLGARHMAGGAITRDTNAIAVVLSESDGLVRAFKGGDLVLELDPEDY
jgi:DNA integrity scanning protein DisA with diadenylate cyclase activity